MVLLLLTERPKVTRRRQGEERTKHGIFGVYGWTGVLMVVAFLLSGVWTLALAVIQVAPTQAANFVMGTSRLDDGDFWTLQRASDGLVAAATALLVSFALGYFGLVAMMTPAFALPKLLLQTTILFRYLREGFPLPTIFFYASMLVLNWMISTYCAMIHLVDPRAPLVRIFSSFDLFFAVFAPLQAIGYAYSHFQFDSAEFATRIETLNPSSFDVIARLFADPREVSLFRAAFRSLQLSSGWSLIVKTALNVFTIYKWWRTIRLLGTSRPEHDASHARSQAHKIGRVSRVFSVLFFGMGAALFVYTVVAVVTSLNACKRFVQCKAPSYRWNVAVLVFVDRQMHIRTFDEWEHPVDTSANLAVLAASGDLKVIQIINRRLSTFPEELRRCHGLEQLSLIYTKTVTIPDWTREFTNLAYLHIEGDLTPTQLQALPRDLFLDMPNLAFLHLGTLRHIPFVPDLDQQSQLKYITLALLHSVTAFPSLDRLQKLERLVIIDATHAATLPSLAKLEDLKGFIIGGRSAVCCNGFLNGVCDLTDFSCRDRTAAGEPRVDCVDARMSPRDRAIVDAVGLSVCVSLHSVDLGAMAATRASTDEACGGNIYKRCQLRGRPGMCYPSRMKVTQCELNPAYEALRRLQIRRGVGDPCDPVVEAWLGCRPK